MISFLLVAGQYFPGLLSSFLYLTFHSFHHSTHLYSSQQPSAAGADDELIVRPRPRSVAAMVEGDGGLSVYYVRNLCDNIMQDTFKWFRMSI